MMARMVTTPEEACFLEIGIPTFNRSQKLSRLLSVLHRELSEVTSDVRVRVTVSDNHSEDETAAMLARHPFRKDLVVRRNTVNVGALNNIWGLLETTSAEYLWLVGDDDLPQPGSVSRIIESLVRYEPTILTFEFEQPPGTRVRRHGSGTGVEELVRLSDAIPQILTLGKLTKQVVRASNLPETLRSVRHVKETGYGWLFVMLEVMRRAAAPKVVVDHAFLAACDEEYATLTEGLTPRFWDDYLLLLDHELVTTHCPEHADAYRYAHPIYMVKMLYGVMAGTTKTNDLEPFRAAARKLRFHGRYFRNPFIFVEWVSLRLGLPASPVIPRIASGLTSIKQSVKQAIGPSTGGGIPG